MVIVNPLKLQLVLISLLLISSTYAQTRKSNTLTEIKNSLQLWNETAKKRDLKAFMNLFDSSSNIILIGSDSGEIFKGKEQIGQWVSRLFEHNSFEWDMKQVEIDNYQNCAWVFMDGNMIITNDKGKQNNTPYRFTGVRNGDCLTGQFHNQNKTFKVTIIPERYPVTKTSTDNYSERTEHWC
jgi:ketosteroid isomerase-like protein